MAIDVNIPSQVKTYANLAGFPATGSLKTIFIAEDTNKTYRWTGSAYVEVSVADLSGYVPTTRTLTINGTTQDLSADRTFTVSTGITIGTTAITSGTVGRVLFEGTGNVVQESANLFWDNTNGRLGIGGTPSTFNLDVNGTARVQGLVTATLSNYNSTHSGNTTRGFYIVNSADSVVRAGIEYDGTNAFVQLAGRYNNGAAFLRQDGSNGNISFLRSGSEYLRIFGATGNVGINTTTDAGFKLDVNGTARVQGNTTISLNQNGVTLINASNTTSGTASTAELRATTGGGFIGLGKYSASTNSYKFIASSDSYLYSATIGDIAIINDFASGRIKFGAGASSTAQATLFSTGNFAINTTTDAGFKLDVNGTARVQDNVTVQKNQNLLTSIDLTNTTSGANAYTQFSAISDVNSGANSFGKYSTLKTAYKIIQPRDSYYYNGSIAGDFAILNDCLSGQIKFAAGGSSTAHMTIKSNGRINMSALPTSSAGLSAGDIWNSSGTLKIV